MVSPLYTGLGRGSLGAYPMPKERTPTMTSKIRLILALAGVLAVTASIGVATGAIPSTSDGTINTCIATFSGTKYLRPIDKQAGESCKTGEKPLTWNQKGLKGDPGLQGPKGATGPAGPKGSGVGTIVQNSLAANVAPGAT